MHKQLLEHLHDDQRMRGRVQLLPQVHIAEDNGAQLLAIDLAYRQSPPSAVRWCSCYAAWCTASWPLEWLQLRMPMHVHHQPVISPCRMP